MDASYLKQAFQLASFRFKADGNAPQGILENMPCHVDITVVTAV
jgi:hypothetical protein